MHLIKTWSSSQISISIFPGAINAVRDVQSCTVCQQFCSAVQCRQRSRPGFLSCHSPNRKLLTTLSLRTVGTTKTQLRVIITHTCLTYARTHVAPLSLTRRESWVRCACAGGYIKKEVFSVSQVPGDICFHNGLPNSALFSIALWAR